MREDDLRRGAASLHLAELKHFHTLSSLGPPHNLPERCYGFDLQFVISEIREIGACPCDRRPPFHHLPTLQCRT